MVQVWEFKVYHTSKISTLPNYRSNGNLYIKSFQSHLQLLKNHNIKTNIPSQILSNFQICFQNLPPLLDDEEYVSYDIESLFTNIPIKDTIEYIVEEIYTQKMLKLICSKLIFKSLLLKLATQFTYTFNHMFYKQIDG